MWLAGGGFLAGMTYSATGSFGHHEAENVVNHYDYQATLMQLFGLDHRRLVYARNGQEMTMTDNQPARIVQEILVQGPIFPSLSHQGLTPFAQRSRHFQCQCSICQRP